MQKYFDKLKEGDKVNVLDPYDVHVVGIERIHFLSILHGPNLNGTAHANLNIITVKSNVLLAYEDKIDGVACVKEKDETFTLWSLNYLDKMT